MSIIQIVFPIFIFYVGILPDSDPDLGTAPAPIINPDHTPTVSPANTPRHQQKHVTDGIDITNYPRNLHYQQPATSSEILLCPLPSKQTLSQSPVLHAHNTTTKPKA